MDDFYNYANLGLFAVSVLVFGLLALACLPRLGQGWALTGLIGGVLTVLAGLPALYRNLRLLVNPSPDLFDSQSWLFDQRINLVLNLVGASGAVLCALAVLLGRGARTPQPHAPAAAAPGSTDPHG